jgi:hypothetical protein
MMRDLYIAWLIAAGSAIVWCGLLYVRAWYL